MKSRVQIFSNSIPEFEFQIPDLEHEQFVRNGNSEGKVMAYPPENESKICCEMSYSRPSGHFIKKDYMFKKHLKQLTYSISL